MIIGGHQLEFIDLVGIVGAALILLGFYRISIGRWSNKSFWYELDNLVGATCLVIYQLHHHAYISVIVNIIWAIISFRGLSSFAQRRKGRRTKPKPRNKKRAS
jgi:hypothetical protein